ncbi:RING finger protein 37-like [Argonauta hians]
MLVNVCDSSLKPAITCNKPTCDGYEINNLIQQTTYRSQGFMVEPFIKPPVTITLKFPCNVDIFKICVNPIVGQQKSLGFEVYTKSDVVKESWLMDSNLIPSVDIDGIFVPVGKVLLKEAQTFCFCNYRFKNPEEVPSTMCCQLELPLKHHQHKALSFISHLSLRITQTYGSCVPCVGKLEIWAKPVSNDNENLVSTVYSCFKPQFTNSQIDERDYDDGEEDEEDNSTIKNATSCLPKSNEFFNLKGVDIPEDFLDSLTCEIMTVPILLPSGQSVDQSTLTSYNNAELKWGRAPNNPFTSMKFTSNYKPIPNTSLKVRIDKFLFDHCQQLTGIPRTVGRASDIQNEGLSVKSKDWVQAARLRAASQKTHSQTAIQPGKSTTKLQQVCGGSNVAASSLNSLIKSHESHNNISNKFSQSQISDGRNFRRPDIGSKRKTLSSSQMDDGGSSCVKRPQSSGYAATYRDSHENNLSQSLNAALSQTLGALPSFRTQNSNNKEIVIQKCIICQSYEDVHLFVLPCTHILCRKCLHSHRQSELGDMKYFCIQCKDLCDSKDIQRLYD